MEAEGGIAGSRPGTATRPPRPADDHPGATAETPWQIPRAGWRQILGRVFAELKADRVGLMAGGVAFYAMVAVVPTLVAAVTLWGLVSDPLRIREAITSFQVALPPLVGEFLTRQVQEVAEAPDTALGWVLITSVAFALWTASAGVRGLINAVNAAYDEDETRTFLRLRAMSLAVTLAGIVFALVTLALIAAVPVVLKLLAVPEPWGAVLRLGRWPLLAVAVMAALAVLYRIAPDRTPPRWPWSRWGAAVATVLWLLGSFAFSWYAANLGRFQATYGALAAALVLMLWFFITAFAILLGAELNAEMERQTLRDTTVGPPAPRGQRGAVVADRAPTDHHRDD